MIRHYIKSALKQAKADPLFTAIYIAGVTLAIATTLVMVTVYNIKIAPMYPEYNRTDTYYVQYMGCVKDNHQRFGQISYSIVKDQIKGIDGVKMVGAISNKDEDHNVQKPDGSGLPVQLKGVDGGFFEIYNFKFIQGEPLTDEDVKGKVKDAVITDRYAEMVFGKETDLVGKMISVDNAEYRIKGVVESASPLMSASFAQVYIPLGISEKELTGEIYERVIGDVIGILVIEDGRYDDVRGELLKRLAALCDGTEWTIKLAESNPISHVANAFRPNASEFSWWDAIKGNILVLVILLFIPALNLCGLISGRMDSRVGELGLRKAFGAQRRTIFMLVLSENFVYTCIGGLLGLLLAIVVVMFGKMALINIVDGSMAMNLAETAEITYMPEMFTGFAIFGGALLLCLLLNIISAMIPAIVSVRRPIVSSLNETKK